MRHSIIFDKRGHYLFLGLCHSVSCPVLFCPALVHAFDASCSCTGLGITTRAPPSQYAPQFPAPREIWSRAAEFGFSPRNFEPRNYRGIRFFTAEYRGFLTFFIRTAIFSQKMTSK